MFDLIAKGELNWVDNTDQLNDFLRKYEIANTDWFDALFQTGVQQQHTVSFSGGGEKSTIYASIGYLHDNGWTISDKVNRYTALLKGTFNITKRFLLQPKPTCHIEIRNYQESLIVRTMQMGLIAGLDESNVTSTTILSSTL